MLTTSKSPGNPGVRATPAQDNMRTPTSVMTTLEFTIIKCDSLLHLMEQ